ncbi:MAG: ATP-binding protein, partial [Flavobacteriales bacterium]|nr:ATP-binding protein [Flavobacteriales bacterium]
KVNIHTDATGATVEIEDNGQGISEKVKDNIFDMFVKGTNKSTGAGLGLYLVKIAVDKIRGKVQLQNNEFSGATISFELPNLAQEV